MRQDNLCSSYCPRGFKNALNNVCVPCVEENCNEIDSTFYYLVPGEDQNNWKIRSNRKVLTPNIDYQKVFNINLEGETDSSKSFTYQLDPNPAQEEVNVQFNFKDDLKDERLVLSVNDDDTNPLFDENRNLLYKTESDVELERICYVSGSRRDSMKALAWTILIAFLVTLAILLVVTFLCCGKMHRLGGLWKFFLHHWMKL